MSFTGRVAKLARSERGKKMFAEAQRIAKDPATKKKIADARRRFARKPAA
jgi:hypothetical protein